MNVEPNISMATRGNDENSKVDVDEVNFFMRSRWMSINFEWIEWVYP